MQELNIQSETNVTDSFCSILEFYDEVQRDEVQSNETEPLDIMMERVVNDTCKKVLLLNLIIEIYLSHYMYTFYVYRFPPLVP